MRKVLIGVIAGAVAVGTIVIGAIGVDFGTSIYAEYRLSSTVRKAANLGSDPFVAILPFPFIPQMMRDHYNQLEIKAYAVDHAATGKATLEATMHSIDLTYASWLIRPDAKLPVGKLESRIIIDSTHLGRYLGITDLMVEAPPQDTNTATGAPPNPEFPAATAWYSAARRSRRTSITGSASRWTFPSPRTTRRQWCSPPPAS